MKTRIICATSVTFVAWLCLSGTALADVSGMLKMCSTCHGEDGVGVESDVPIIAGIPAIIQEDAIFAYIDGDRTCGTKPLMCSIVLKLTEEQVTELAEHYAAMPYIAAGEDFDAALAEKGEAIHQASCAICHGADDAIVGESSILQGQRKDYLRYALQQYASAERKQLPAMQKKTGALSSDDIEALLNYYASYRN